MNSHMKGARACCLLVGGVAVLTIVACRKGSTPSGKTSAAPSQPPAAGTPAMSTMPGMASMPGMGASSPDSGSVRLSPDDVRHLGIAFATAAVRPLSSDIQATGVVVVDERRVAEVAPKVSGFVERLAVSATGQFVRRGDPLLDLYSPNVLAAEQELLVAAASKRAIEQSSVPGVPAAANDLLDAARHRLELWDVSDAQIDAVLRTGRPPRTVTLYSPATGVVIDKRVVAGQAVNAGETFYTIADLSHVWIDIQLREADAAAVRAGVPVDMTVTGLPNRDVRGRLAYVYPALDSTARAVRARVVVANPEGALKLGMYATARIHAGGASALTVPSSAVLRTGQRTVVFVDQGGGRLLPTVIHIGRTGGDYTEVLNGLEAGERVATSAQFLLDSESNLGQVIRAMIGQAPGQMTP